MFDSDGFVWVRTPVPVRIDTSEPLALRISSVSRAWTSDEVFVAGVRVGSFGRVPPNSFFPALPLDNVFEIPADLTHPGAVAVGVKFVISLQSSVFVQALFAPMQTEKALRRGRFSA